MSRDYVVRRYQPSDEEGIIKLLELVFDGWPPFDLDCIPLEHWKWKFEDNPYKGMLVPVAESGDLIVGSNHAYSMRIKVGNKVLSCSQATDLAVHPDFRRLGIYKKISEFKTKLHVEMNHNLAYAITFNPIVVKTNIEWGRSTFPYPILFLIRVNDVYIHFKMKKSKNRYIKTLGTYLIRTINKIQNFLNKRPETLNQKISISLIHSFDDRIDKFWNEIKDHYSFIIERKKDYLNWRYCDPRGGKYIVKAAEEENRILGYIILRINRYKPDYPEGFIVDLLTIPKRIDVAGALLRDSIRYFENQKINCINTWVIKGHPYESLYKHYGFFYRRLRPYMIIQLFDVGSEWNDFRRAPADRLHFQYGDTDGI